MLAGLLVTSCVAGIWFASPLLQAAAVVAAVVLALRLAAQARRHARLARALDAGSVPGRLAGIALRWRALQSGAAVAGLRRPAIYCDPRLDKDLTVGELRAVVLHERFHQLRRHPLKLLALTAIEPLASLTATGRAWVEQQRARLEIDADRFALHHGADRADLAGAILKLGGVAPASTAAGFASAIDLRLQALIDQNPPAVSAGTATLRRWLLLATFTIGVCGLAVSHHLLALGGSVGCVLVGC